MVASNGYGAVACHRWFAGGAGPAHHPSLLYEAAQAPGLAAAIAARKPHAERVMSCPAPGGVFWASRCRTRTAPTPRQPDATRRSCALPCSPRRRTPTARRPSSRPCVPSRRPSRGRTPGSPCRSPCFPGCSIRARPMGLGCGSARPGRSWLGRDGAVEKEDASLLPAPPEQKPPNTPHPTSAPSGPDVVQPKTDPPVKPAGLSVLDQFAEKARTALGKWDEKNIPPGTHGAINQFFRVLSRTGLPPVPPKLDSPVEPGWRRHATRTGHSLRDSQKSPRSGRSGRRTISRRNWRHCSLRSTARNCRRGSARGDRRG